MFCNSTFVIGWLVGLGHDRWDNGSKPSINGSPRNLRKRLVWDQGWKPTFENFSPRPLKRLAGEPTQIFEDRRQLKVRNFETAQHIDKRIPDISSRINEMLYKTVSNLGLSPQGVFCNLWRTLANYKWVSQTCVYCLISQNVLLVGPLRPAYNVSATVASTPNTYRFGGCGLPKVFGDWKCASNYGKIAYRRLLYIVDSESQASLNGSLRNVEMCTQVWHVVRTENLFGKTSLAPNNMTP